MEGMFIQTITMERMSECLNHNVAAPMLHSHSKARLPFKELAKKEVQNEIRPEEKEKSVINVFSRYGIIDHTADEKQSLLLNLTAQDYVVSQWKKRLTSCTKVGVFYKQKLLWYTSRLEKNTEPAYLNKTYLEKRLEKAFGIAVCLKLGLLTWETTKFIAWQFKTEDGQEFLIPWHNAALIPQTPEMAFVAKDFKEIRNTYKILRFRELRFGELYALILA